MTLDLCTCNHISDLERRIDREEIDRRWEVMTPLDVASKLLLCMQRSVQRKHPDDSPLESGKHHSIFREFYGKADVEMSLGDYVARVVRYSDASIESLTLLHILLTRICQLGHQHVNIHTIHRLFAAGLLISMKLSSDKVCANKYYAKVAGVKVKELNKLELLFVALLDFRLFAHEDELRMHFQHLVDQ